MVPPHQAIWVNEIGINVRHTNHNAHRFIITSYCTKRGLKNKAGIHCPINHLSKGEIVTGIVGCYFRHIRVEFAPCLHKLFSAHQRRRPVTKPKQSVWFILLPESVCFSTKIPNRQTDVSLAVFC